MEWAKEIQEGIMHYHYSVNSPVSHNFSIRGAELNIAIPLLISGYENMPLGTIRVYTRGVNWSFNYT